jgi:two-component system chemotaxis response regulator CheY
VRSLIVDDDELSRSMQQEILSSHFDCDVASNGEEAVYLFSKALADTDPYHLIFMDVTMPICNGHYALSEIRLIEKEQGISSNDQVKIFMLTASDDAQTVMESYCKGCTSYIVKPVNKNKIVQILKNFKVLKD